MARGTEASPSFTRDCFILSLQPCLASDGELLPPGGSEPFSPCQPSWRLVPCSPVLPALCWHTRAYCPPIGLRCSHLHQCVPTPWPIGGRIRVPMPSHS